MSTLGCASLLSRGHICYYNVFIIIKELYIYLLKNTYMANAKKKPVARRSRRSGVKKMELVRKNNEILQRLIKQATK